MLFCAARAELVDRVIAPALEAGRDVVCDRFVDSTVAYQGGARGIDPASSRRSTPPPSATACPTGRSCSALDTGVAGERAEGRCESPISDRFESEGIGFQDRIAAAFDRIAAAEPDRVAVVDAAGTVEEVHGRIARGAGACERTELPRGARRRHRRAARRPGRARRGAPARPLARLLVRRPDRQRQGAPPPARSPPSSSPTGADDPAEARRRALADPSPASRPHLAAPARQPAPRRGRPPRGDRRRRLPAVRGRAPRLRDRGRRRDGRGEPERAAEDARGAARLRPPDPDHRRAGGAARDGPQPPAPPSRSRRCRRSRCERRLAEELPRPLRRSELARARRARRRRPRPRPAARLADRRPPPRPRRGRGPRRRSPASSPTAPGPT